MAKKEVKEAIKYSKQAIVNSKRYANRKDILNVLLEEEREYSFDEIDSILDDFMSKEVK